MGKRGNGEGSIRKRKDGLWEGRYTAGRDPKTGKLVPRSVYAHTRRECKEKLDAAIQAADKGAIYVSGRLSVAEWLHVYLWRIKRPRVKPTTFDGYIGPVQRCVLPAPISAMKMDAVRRHHVQTFIDDMQGAGATPFMIRNVYGILRNAFAEAERRGVIPISYAGSAELPARKPKPTAILTQTEQKTFMDAIEGHRMEAAFILALTTGAREGEIAALMWEDYKNGMVTITKDAARVNTYDGEGNRTGSKVIIQDTPKTAAGVRSIPLMPIAEKALLKHRIRQNDEKMKNRLLYADNGLVFCNEVGGVYEPSYYRKALHKALDAAGLPRVKFHALRHTFATRGLEAGVSGKELQSLLGHESPEMVAHYQQLLDEQARAAISKMTSMFGDGA